MISRPPVSGLRSPWLILLVSAAIQFLCFARWPGNTDRDVSYSIFAAQNLIHHGQLRSINPLGAYGRDVAQYSRLRWMQHWPPAHSLLYAAVMGLGAQPGTATKLLGLLCVVVGGLGWLRLVGLMDAPGYLMVVLAAAYPLLPFINNVYVVYQNDHLAPALAPWICWAILRMEPLGTLASEQWGRLLAAGLLAGSTMLVKYSLAPILAAAGLYVLWLDGKELSTRRLWRLAAFSTALVLPGLLLMLMNRAWGGKYPLPADTTERTSIFLPLLIYCRNILNNTVADGLGWVETLLKSSAFLRDYFHVEMPRGVIVVVSFVLLAIWVRHFRRVPWRGMEQRLGVFLLLFTASLWIMLAMMTARAGIGFNFSGYPRLYKPVTLLWMLLCAVSLGRMKRGDLVRSPAFYSMILSITFLAVAQAGNGLLGRPYARMPNSGLAWAQHQGDSVHSAFVSNFIARRGRGPDLLISDESKYMVELGIPSVYWLEQQGPAPQRRPQADRPSYRSSVDMEVWMIVEPASEQFLLEDLQGASSVERVEVPAGFPYQFYIFKFAAGNPG